MHKQILVVDDELHVSQILGRRLEREGYAVETARDGVEAVERLDSFAPDLVVSDLQMPRADGMALARMLSADPRTSRTPIILLTARGHRVDQEVLARTNIVRLMAKPFSSHEMVSVVSEILAGNAREAA